MFPLLKRREIKRAVGWGDELIIRPDTPLSAAQKKQLAKAIRRAKRDGKIAATAQQTIPYEEMYVNGVCSLGYRLYSKSIAFEDRSYAKVFGIVLNHRNVENETEKVQAFADSAGLRIVGEIPRSDDIIRYEDMGKTVIEGDPGLPISRRFMELAELLWKEECP